MNPSRLFHLKDSGTKIITMIHRTFLADRQIFDDLKETGMGYQVILAQLVNNRDRNFYIVYNSELIIDIDNDFDVFKYRAFITKGIQLSLSEASPLQIDFNSINVLSKSFSKDLISRFSKKNFSGSRNKSENKNRKSGGKGAIDSPLESASGEEVFTRLSAFEKDRRIDLENKCLKEGSFTTTFIDYRDCVRFYDDPVDRYALPNDDEIKFAFTIVPSKIDKLQRGIVQPAFGKAGGGIESYFDKGTSHGSYIGKRKYGD